MGMWIVVDVFFLLPSAKEITNERRDNIGLLCVHESTNLESSENHDIVYDCFSFLGAIIFKLRIGATKIPIYSMVYRGTFEMVSLQNNLSGSYIEDGNGAWWAEGGLCI